MSFFEELFDVGGEFAKEAATSLLECAANHPKEAVGVAAATIVTAYELGRDHGISEGKYEGYKEACHDRG